MAKPEREFTYAETLINIWGRHRFGGEDGDHFTLHVNHYSYGCETCGDSFTGIEVYKNGREVGEIANVVMHELLAEILDPLNALGGKEYKT